MREALAFDAATHTYTDRGGRRVPNVTSILEPLYLFDFEDNPFITPEILNAARDFGANVHLACHLVNQDELDLSTLHPALLPYVTAWKAFLCEAGFIVTHSEQRVYHPGYGYAGTLDARAVRCVRGKPESWLIDIKSGALPWTVGFQTAAYREACEEKPRKRLAVQLLDTGRYRLHEQKDIGDFAVFLSALNIWKARARKRAPVNVSEYA